MGNYLLLSNKKQKNEILHFLGKSVINGMFIYEILLNKANKTETLVKQLHCKTKNIITDLEIINIHISVLQMKKTINIFKL